MSLTFLGRGIVFAVLGVLAAYAGWAWAVPLARYVIAAQDSTQYDLRISDRILAYRLEPAKPLVFVFSQPVEQTRIIAHAAVDTAQGAALGATYELHVALFDAEGVEVAEYTQAMLAGRDDGFLPDGRPRRFYRSGDAEIWGQDQIVIQHPEPFARVAVTLQAADPMVAGVDVRAYERRPVLAGEERAVFLRRSEEERAAMTAFSPFPLEMLSPEEIRNLAMNAWRPLGPVGIEGRDYEALVIYEAASDAAEAES